ncbi:poly-gamma-glutamate hydrolase family protein [Staphylococcus saccharolyticus]|uniref:poly-gamma-glutamate hydrolase family protein n=1 Tax=Staphylococcus saccharolyticus TaxID=33028 RepID=UPI0032DF9899
MKVKSSSRFFSMKKVTLSFVTVFIGIGTIGSLNQYADASTKTQQTHVTTSSPTKTTTHTVKRSVKPTTVKSRTISTKRVKPITQQTKIKTVKKEKPIQQTSTSTKRVKSPTTQSTKKATTTKKPTTLNKTRTATKTQPTTRKISSTSTRPKTVQPSKTKTQPTSSTQINTTTTKAKQLSTPTTSKIDSSKELVDVAPTELKTDKYQSMTQLEKETTEGVDWRKNTKDTGNQVLIVAPHGGSIEQGTTELTKALANKSNYDYYSFEGIRPKNNSELHVTSTYYDDPTLNQMIKNRTASVSIHGASGSEEIVYLGGPRSDLRNEIEKQLVGRGFTVKVPPEYLGGQNNNNFINREDNNTGVQLELTTALRKAFFTNGDISTKNRTNEKNWTSKMYSFINGLYAGIRNTYSSK